MKMVAEMTTVEYVFRCTEDELKQLCKEHNIYVRGDALWIANDQELHSEVFKMITKLYDITGKYVSCSGYYNQGHYRFRSDKV